MKIKHQLLIYVLCILLIPLVCSISIPLSHFLLTKPDERVELFKEIQDGGDIDFSNENQKAVMDELRHLPKEIDFMVFKNGKTLYSTIEKYTSGSYVNLAELMDYIRKTSDNYSYQFETPGFPPYKEQTTVRLLTRMKKDNFGKRPEPFFPKVLIIIIIAITIVTITGIVLISRSIFKSTKKLVVSTTEIASGNLSVKLNEKDFPNNEFKVISESIETMRQNLQEDQDRKARFIMGVSHDLRTPIAVIKGYCEAINDGVIPASDTEKTIKIIQEKSDQLESMINTLINYVKLDSKDWRSEIKPENFSEFIKNFSKSILISGKLYKKTVTCSINLSENLQIPMNSMLVWRAFENIFTNSVRYTKENGTICFSVQENQDSVDVKLEDNGCGIPEEDLKHIYDLFYRVSKSRTEKGMGIGLSVVKNIMDIHNWEINVKSEPEKGTAFTITIPKINDKS